MALITCKDCKKEFSTDAKRCPHCGSKKPIKQWNLGKFFLVVLGLMFLGAILEAQEKAMLPPIPPKTDAEIKKEAEQDLEIDLGYYCQGLVKKTLHDPDSAEFDNPSHYYVSNKKGIYTVEVTLRARNGFNALRKFTVDCSVLVGKDHKIIPIGMKEID